MRTVRVVLISALVAGALAVVAPGATASTPAASKTCKSLNSLDQKLHKALASADTGKVDTGAASDVSSSFRKAAKSSPGSLSSAMRTIATVAGNVAHSTSTVEAAAALRSGGGTLTSAVVTFGAYIAKHCPA